jgi:hypothetical protein
LRPPTNRRCCRPFPGDLQGSPVCRGGVRLEAKSAFHRDLDHHRLDHSRQPGAQRPPRTDLRAGGHTARRAGAGRHLVEKCLERYGTTGTVIATTSGKQLAGLNFKHPLYDAAPWLCKRLSPVYLADYVSDADGTGIVHSAPAYGVDDFNSCVAHGMKYDDILNPVQGNGSYAADLPLFGGMNIWKACARHSRRCWHKATA